MPACDGGKCAESIPWRVTKAGLQIEDEKTFPFKADDIHAKLVALLKDLNCSVATKVKKADIPFKNLCPACWTKESKNWGNPKDYEAPRAKTTAAGVYFQVMAPDWKTADKLDKATILSCAVHEGLHYLSFKSVGLQDLGKGATDWDEAVTDLLGYEVFKRMAPGGLKEYVTPYGTYCKGIDASIKKFQAIGVAKFIRPDGAALRAKLPPALKEILDKPENQDLKKGKATTDLCLPALRTLMWEYFTHWYFLGTGVKHPDGPGDGTAATYFGENGILVFMPIGNTFPGYTAQNFRYPTT